MYKLCIKHKSGLKWWPCKFPWTPLELPGLGSGHCTLSSEPFRMNSGGSGGTRQESRWGTQGREAVAAVTPSICHELLGLDVMIFVYWMLSFSPVFPRAVGEVKWKGKFLLGWDKTRSWEGVERETLGADTTSEEMRETRIYGRWTSLGGREPGSLGWSDRWRGARRLLRTGLQSLMLCAILPIPTATTPYTVFSRRRREGGHPRESGLSPVWVRVGWAKDTGFLR